LTLQGQGIEESAVDIGVGHRGELQQVFGIGRDFDGGAGGSNHHAELDVQRDGRSHVHVLVRRLELRGSCTEVIVIVGHVVELKFPLTVSRRRPAVVRHGILNLNNGPDNDGARWIED